MALNSAAVRVGITGEMFVAPVGSTAPTDSTTALDGAFVGLGYVSEDGITESYDDTVEDIRAWQLGQIVRTITSESKATLELTLIETKAAVLELFHKGSTVETSGTEWRLDVKAPSPDPRAFVLNVIDGSNHLRLWVPRGEVEQRGAIQYANNSAEGYEVTITCYPNADQTVLTKFSDDPNFGATS